MTTSPESHVSPYRFIAAGLGSGWLPRAPGTWGSLAALVPAWLIIDRLSPLYLLIAAVLLLAVGCYVCMRLLPQLESDDPGWIVIDEWVGQWICTAVMGWFVPSLLPLLLLSFLMFRLFDVFKPWPVSWLERNGPAWWSIMADDVGAGLLGAVAGLLLFALYGMVFV